MKSFSTIISTDIIRKRFVIFITLIMVSLSLLVKGNAQCTNTEMLTSNGATIAGSGLQGLLCLLCSVSGTANVVNPDTTDHASISIVAGVASSGYIRMDLPQTYPAGTRVGWVADVNGGVAGLFNGVTLKAYLGDSLLQTVSGGTLINLLGFRGGKNINAVFCHAFDRIEISMGSLAGVVANYRVFYAYVAESCTFPVKCGASPSTELCGDAIDNDGDGLVDNEDTCINQCLAGSSAPLLSKN